MALLTKSDLSFNYRWSAIPSDDPRVRGEPDSTLFNRHEGYEVLHLINTLAKEWHFNDKARGLEIERLIHESLPSDMRSQEDVKAWIFVSLD